MKVSVTIDFSDEDRKALNHSHGASGKASREELVGFIHMSIWANMADLHSDMQDEESRKAEDENE